MRADCGQFVRTGHALVYCDSGVPEMKGRPQFQPWATCPADDPIAYVNGVLKVRKNDPFFQNKIADLIGPNRQPIFQQEFAQKIGALQIDFTAAPSYAASFCGTREPAL